MQIFSQFYWLCRNTLKGLWGFARRRPVLAFALYGGGAALFFILRAQYQPLVLEVRKYFPLIVLGVIMLWVVVEKFRSSRWRGKAATLLAVAVLGAIGYSVRLEPYRYVMLYVRYRTLSIVTLDQLPVTGYERIQPLHSVRVNAREAMAETESASNPDFVRIGGEYRWTMAIEPSYRFLKLTDHVRELFSIPATTPSPNFFGQNRKKVEFDVGENLILGRRSAACAIKSFGILRYFSYEPADVKYLLDDNGEWVQVITLIRWRGWIFPWPEFGGVHVIKQGRATMWGAVKRAFFGAGEWIAPEDI